VLSRFSVTLGIGLGPEADIRGLDRLDRHVLGARQNQGRPKEIKGGRC